MTKPEFSGKSVKVLPLRLLSATSIHERKIVEHFGPTNRMYDGISKLPLQQSVFMCFTNRCGSNYLADLLANTGLFPHAGEFLGWQWILSRSTEWKCETLGAFFAEHSSRFSRNGIFACKASSEQLLMLTRLGYVGTLFPNAKFLWLERNDMVGQAISFSIAAQTAQWRSDQRSRASGTPEYRFTEILMRIQSIAEANARFAMLLTITGASFMKLTYEELVHSPTTTLRSVLSWLGLKPPRNQKLLADSSLTKQASQINEEFRARFLEDVAKSPQLWETINTVGS